MSRKRIARPVSICALLLVALAAMAQRAWKIHDMERPVPPVVDPGTASTAEQPGRPPSDATVLFDGRDLSKWRSQDGSPAKWKVEGGVFETVRGTGYRFAEAHS